MESPPFEDVFPIEHGDFPVSHVSKLRGVYNTRWCFQIFFIFTPTWGDDPLWLIFFRWVETANQNKYVYRLPPRKFPFKQPTFWMVISVHSCWDRELRCQHIHHYSKDQMRRPMGFWNIYLYIQEGSVHIFSSLGEIYQVNPFSVDRYLSRHPLDLM